MQSQSPMFVVWLLTGVLFIVIALPMILGRVPRNGLYGFRTPKTMGSDAIWYPANRYAGWQMLGAGVVTVVASAILMSFTRTMTPDQRAWAGLNAMVIPLIVAVIRSMLYLRTL